VIVMLLGLSGCSLRTQAREPPPEPLYFSVELSQAGHRIGSPKLIGFTGKKVIAERRSPGASLSDYRLTLEPEGRDGAYQLGIKVELPDNKAEGDVSLLHGEERRVLLANRTEVKVLLMRVNSEEFRWLVGERPQSFQRQSI
jgi:hypothetical protein